MFFDVHSHVLHGVDDGSQSLEESIELLKLLRSQGVTSLALTPHFYPHQQNLEDFFNDVASAFGELKAATEANPEFPELLLGCELLYCKGILRSELINKFCIANSNFLLIETTDFEINNDFFSEIKYLMLSGITPIIAHPERYYRSKNYRKFLKFLAKENIIIQVNASSFSEETFKPALKKLFKLSVPILLGSDTHTTSYRPPSISTAFEVMTKFFGRSACEAVIETSNLIYDSIKNPNADITDSLILFSEEM